MMNGIREWATVLCITAVIAVMFELLSPSGKMEKMMRFVLGAFLLCALLVPLTGTATQISVDFTTGEVTQPEISAFQNKVDEQTEQAITGNLQSIALQALAEEQITPQKMDVRMDRMEDDSISITEIVLYLASEHQYSASTAKQILENTLGIPTEVVINQE